MKEINPDFNIPYYVFEALMNYKKGDLLQLKRLELCLNMAVINRKLSEEQRKFLFEKYC